MRKYIFILMRGRQCIDIEKQIIHSRRNGQLIHDLLIFKQNATRTNEVEMCFHVLFSLPSKPDTTCEPT